LFCIEYFTPTTMQLMMFIGNDLIESVPLETARISKPGYVGNFKRILKLKHNELIQQSAEKPEFLICEPPGTSVVPRHVPDAIIKQ
jgi:hypothetical protein